MKNRHSICELVGGSRLYGTSTENSDIDIRGVYVSHDPSVIMGLSRDDHYVRNDSEQDVAIYELKKFMGLLKKTNTQALEILCAPDAKYTINLPAFEMIRKNRYRLIDSQKLFSTLQGYMFGEQARAFGKSSRKLGTRRKADIERLGYSPKNLAQLIRLGYCGEYFYNHGRFPVCLDTSEHAAIHEIIMDTKRNRFTLPKAEQLAQRAVDDLNAAKQNSQVSMEFDNDLAQEILLEIYFPILEKHHKG